MDNVEVCSCVQLDVLEEMIKNIFFILLVAIALTSCASSSKHWTEKRMIVKTNPLTNKKYTQEITVDIIKQKGIIKAKHPTGAEAESEPYVKMPDYPPRVN